MITIRYIKNFLLLAFSFWFFFLLHHTHPQPQLIITHRSSDIIIQGLEFSLMLNCNHCLSYQIYFGIRNIDGHINILSRTVQTCDMIIDCSDT